VVKTPCEKGSELAQKSNPEKKVTKCIHSTQPVWIRLLQRMRSVLKKKRGKESMNRGGGGGGGGGWGGGGWGGWWGDHEEGKGRGTRNEEGKCEVPPTVTNFVFPPKKTVG